ncbi:uncharacterized protein [Lolium perenne]|uniref:uncharacterized protein n=1 Tax=Lolium perenne TaxID=4522 RepID=UPI0021F5DD6C|nr:uncharacterized protein LOC127303214 [Lolium perenne]
MAGALAVRALDWISALRGTVVTSKATETLAAETIKKAPAASRVRRGLALAINRPLRKRKGPLPPSARRARKLPARIRRRRSSNNSVGGIAGNLGMGSASASGLQHRSPRFRASRRPSGGRADAGQAAGLAGEARSGEAVGAWSSRRCDAAVSPSRRGAQRLWIGMGEVAAGSRAGGVGGEVAAGTLGGAGVGLVVELSEESAVGGSGAMQDFRCIIDHLVGPITAWRKRDLGAGGRRPEPTVSALVGNASWLLFGWTEALVEPLRLNLWGGGCQIPGLLVFFWLCTPAERRRALGGPICVAVIYLALTSVFGVFHIHLGCYQVLCTVAGMVAAAAPLFTFIFLMENTGEELLPHRAILGFSAIHGLLWCARGFILYNGFMLIQNLIGLSFSVLQLCIKTFYGLPDMYHGSEDFEQELLAHLPVIEPPVDVEQGLQMVQGDQGIPPLMPGQEELPPMAGQEIQDPLVPDQEEEDEEDEEEDDDDDEESDDDEEDDDHHGGGVNYASDECSPSPDPDSTAGQSVPGELQSPAPQDATSSGTPGVSSGKGMPPRRSSRLALASNKTPSKQTPIMVASNKTPSKPTPTMVASNKTPSKLTMVLRSSTTRNTPTSGSESSSTTANIPSGSGRKRQR